MECNTECGLVAQASSSVCRCMYIMTERQPLMHTWSKTLASTGRMGCRSVFGGMNCSVTKSWGCVGERVCWVGFKGAHTETHTTGTHRGYTEKGKTPLSEVCRNRQTNKDMCVKTKRRSSPSQDHNPIYPPPPTPTHLHNGLIVPVDEVADGLNHAKLDFIINLRHLCGTEVCDVCVM